MNLDPVSWKVKAIAAVAGVAIVAGAGAAFSWWLTSTSYKAEIGTLNATHADEKAQWEREKTAITVKAQQDTAKALASQQAAQERANQLDAEYTLRLANADKENEALRRDVALGNKRVYILTANLATAKLAASQHAAGAGTGAGAVGDDVPVELSAAGEQTVLDLQQSTSKDDEVIQYLQGYIRDVVKQCKLR